MARSGFSGTKTHTLLLHCSSYKTPGVRQGLVTPFHGPVNWSSVRGRGRTRDGVGHPREAGRGVCSGASQVGLLDKTQGAQRNFKLFRFLKYVSTSQIFVGTYLYTKKISVIYLKFKFNRFCIFVC